MKKVLILGSDSFLGNALLNNLNKKKIFYSIRGTSRRTKRGNKLFFDFRKKNTIDFGKYDVVIVVAAITNIAFCEKNKNLCESVNYKLTVNIIKKILKKNCFVLFISSNAVFDGSKKFYSINDKKKPTTVYGRSKALVEDWIISKNFRNCSILRLTKVLSKNYRSIYKKKWENEVRNKNKFLINHNVYLSPITIDQAVKSVRRCILLNKNGLFHKGGNKEVSYYDFAKKICANNRNLFSKIKVIKKKRIKVYNSLKTFLE